jgi:hypothetical protein
VIVGDLRHLFERLAGAGRGFGVDERHEFRRFPFKLGLEPFGVDDLA